MEQPVLLLCLMCAYYLCLLRYYLVTLLYVRLLSRLALDCFIYAFNKYCYYDKFSPASYLFSLPVKDLHLFSLIINNKRKKQYAGLKTCMILHMQYNPCIQNTNTKYQYQYNFWCPQKRVQFKFKLAR